MNHLIDCGRSATLGRVLGACCCALLAACGGGGDAPPPPEEPSAPMAPAPAQPVSGDVRDGRLLGAFGGTLAGGASVQDIVVVTDLDGQLLAVYGSNATGEFEPAGLLVSLNAAGASDTLHRSAGAFDWGQQQTVSIELTLDPAIPSMSGTVTASGTARAISGGALPAVGYRIADAARLEAIAGRWTLKASTGELIALDIDAEGRIRGVGEPCRVDDGRVRPTVSGRNVYALFVQISGCNAPFAGSDGVYGFAVAYQSAGGGQQLVVGGWNGWDPVYLAAAGKR